MRSLESRLRLPLETPLHVAIAPAWLRTVPETQRAFPRVIPVAHTCFIHWPSFTEPGDVGIISGVDLGNATLADTTPQVFDPDICNMPRPLFTGLPPMLQNLPSVKQRGGLLLGRLNWSAIVSVVRPLLFLWLVLFSYGCSKQQKPEDVALLPFGAVNPPAPDSVVTGAVPVGGWAIHESGIESITLYVDRAFVGQAVLGDQRPDVEKVYPQFAAQAIGGFHGELETAGLTAGRHELIVRIRAKNGSMRDISTTFITAN